VLPQNGGLLEVLRRFGFVCGILSQNELVYPEMFKYEENSGITQ